MGTVTPDQVKRVALLGRLRLEGAALTTIAAQLDQILGYVRQLESVPTDHVEPTSHVLPLSNVLRDDARLPSLSQEVVVALAPAGRPPFVAVPKVIETAT